MDIRDHILKFGASPARAPIEEKILAAITSANGEMSIGVLFNRMRREKRKDVSEAVVKMLDEGILTSGYRQHPVTKVSHIWLTLPPKS